MATNKLAYIIAVVNEFAARFALNSQQAYRYLDRFKGIDFVDEFYNVEHTQPFEDVVDDLASIAVRMEEHWHDLVSRFKCGNRSHQRGASLCT